MPKNWESLKLGDVLEKIEGGGTPSKDKVEYWHGSIPWASVKDIVSHNPLDTIDHITEAGLRNSSSKLIPAGTLITPTRMALGRVVIYEVPVAINQDLKALYPKNSLNKWFLYYWLQKNRSTIEQLGKGSTVSGIQLSELRALPIHLPSLTEQNQIVKVLRTWDKYLELIDSKISLKRSIRNSLTHLLLSGKERIAGFSDEWKSLTLGQIGKVSMCKRVFKDQTSSSGDIPFYKIGTFGKNPDAYISRSLYEEFRQKYSFPNKGDILISASGTIGRTVVYDGQPAYFQDSNIIWIANDEKIVLNSFLYHAYKKVTWHTAQGTIARLYNDNVKRIKITIPSFEEQSIIAKILNNADEELDLLIKERKLITAQRDYLTHNLVTGKLRISAEKADSKETTYA